MKKNKNISAPPPLLRRQEGAEGNERFVAACMERLSSVPDPEEGLRMLLAFLGEGLACDRVYVFEEMDRQHIRNTYEWCAQGVSSGISQLPYLAKKDLSPWYERLAGGGNIIEPKVETLRQRDPLIYGFLQPQGIRSIILSPLIAQGAVCGLLGADNPPPEQLAHISVLFDVLAHFVVSQISQRDLSRLRDGPPAPQRPRAEARHTGKTILLVDDSPELLRINERVLRPEGYSLLSAGTLQEARTILDKTKPDAIVMDIDLPDGSGLDFCRTLRTKAAIPVVFLTARSDARTVREAMAAGGGAFLTKPYRLEDLREAVAAAADGNEQTNAAVPTGRRGHTKENSHETNEKNTCPVPRAHPDDIHTASVGDLRS